MHTELLRHFFEGHFFHSSYGPNFYAVFNISSIVGCVFLDRQICVYVKFSQRMVNVNLK